MVDHGSSWLTMENNGCLPCFVKWHHGFDQSQISPTPSWVGDHGTPLSTMVVCGQPRQPIIVSSTRECYSVCIAHFQKWHSIYKSKNPRLSDKITIFHSVQLMQKFQFVFSSIKYILRYPRTGSWDIGFEGKN